MAVNIRALWTRLTRLPGGRWLFSRALGRIVPYTGSIRASVRQLRAGHALIEMRDRRRLRNHLGSHHAIALANLAELTTGLPLAYAVQPAGRAILLSLRVDFLRKARGTITGISDFSPPNANVESDIEIPVELLDREGVVVARALARWRVGPTQRPPA